ncbi:PQQ-binding-like beta-propeller repeat protein [Catalinimonas sp. 4WD22]|uniref:outer membrane protein assembly factor BamB family protein n=1 Tax=Catalinimonas locisalis TaxID=3133978 RepID=UPI003101559E
MKKVQFNIDIGKLKCAFLASAFATISLILCSGCASKKTELVWDKNFYRIGSQSSPRASDLNQDGVLDIVMGAGQNEHQYTEQGVLAFDGKSGELLWQQETSDQVYGSATFCDINQDGVEDVFIGGRSPHLKALNGKNGEVIWQYNYQYEDDSVLKYARFNFQNSVLVPDQNQDGLPDLLIVNGGNSKAEPHSEKDRYPGVLMLFDSKNGKILAADTMPDGKEAYMPPLVFSSPDNSRLQILFGTGGETLPGHLYLADLSDFMEGKLSNAKIIASEEGHGFIAPPVLVDISQDGIYDIVAISHASTVFAINGKDNTLLWQKKLDNTECSNSFAVGYFTDDDIPDLFTFVSKGEWPENTGSKQVMLDGKNGEIVYLDSMGCTGFSSPVVYDLNHDGRDEVIISINEYDCAGGFTKQAPAEMLTKLIAIDFSNQSVNVIDQVQGFKNIFTTPWIGDLDQDGYLDIVHCQYYSPSIDLIAFMGMRVKRISTHIKIEKPVKWGAYMGSAGDGIFTTADM